MTGGVAEGRVVKSGEGTLYMWMTGWGVEWVCG